jgi:acetyl-CoA carboxylase carboxyl transferase subunit alpha
MPKSKVSAWERVSIARMNSRPTAKYYIDKIFKNFIEFHGDRNFRDDPAIIGGVAMFGKRAVTVIAEEKGVTTNEKTMRNFGSPHPEGYRKAIRLMKQAEKFMRPIICFVDTQGAYCGIGAEERGQGEAIAKNLFEMTELKVPVISIIIGEGGSGGALAIAVANKVLMLENAVYSILSPEGFASILWKDGTRASEAAEVMKITAADLLELGIIEEIILEPEGGAQENPDMTVKFVKEAITKNLKELTKLSQEELKQNRYERFRAF